MTSEDNPKPPDPDDDLPLEGATFYPPGSPEIPRFAAAHDPADPSAGPDDWVIVHWPFRFYNAFLIFLFSALFLALALLSLDLVLDSGRLWAHGKFGLFALIGLGMMAWMAWWSLSRTVLIFGPTRLRWRRRLWFYQRKKTWERDEVESVCFQERFKNIFQVVSLRTGAGETFSLLTVPPSLASLFQDAHWLADIFNIWLGKLEVAMETPPETTEPAPPPE